MHILYGAPHSLFTGKVRAYLRKQGIPYTERTPAHPLFRAEIVPVIGRSIIPVVVCPDGKIIQDSVDIIAYFDGLDGPCPARPTGAAQEVVAHALELYGSMGLIRHAMHYRWSYLEEQRAFLTDAFTAGSGPKAATAIMGRMASYLPPLGITEDTIPQIEASYERLLDVLDAHFAVHPYLLGGHPTIADYGLFGPLYAHLARDPVPGAILKCRAPKVARWIERMNAPDADVPEYAEAGGLLPDDGLPPSLEPLLAHAAGDLFPELQDKRAFLLDLSRTLAPEDGAPVSAKPHQRTLGTVRTAFRGVPVEVGVQPYLLYLWQKVTDAYARAPIDARQSIAALFDRVGLAPLLTEAPPVRVERRDHIEVWARPKA